MSAKIARMAFYHPEGLVKAWKSAETFAGEGGRVATLPDIVDARLASPDTSAAWGQYYTTASAEFYGRSPGGAEVLAVLHGVGPLSTLEGCLQAASYDRRFSPKRTDGEGGRIPEALFHEILDGKFGDVAIVELVPYLTRYAYPFSSMPASQAVEDPLAAARFGGRERLEAYVRRLVLIENESARMSGNPLRDDPKVLRVSEDSNSGSYSRPVSRVGSRGFDFVPRNIEEGLAFAHLLSTGQLTNVGESGDPGYVVQVEVTPHGWTDGTRFVGWRAQAKPGAIHPGIALYDLSDFDSDDLWVDDDAEQQPLEVLVRKGGALFTQYPKEGASLDSGEARHRVESSIEIGKPVVFKTKVHGYYGFFKYELSDVAAIAPEGANAYILLGDTSVSGNGDVQTQTIQFHRVQVDRRRRLLRNEELLADVERLVRIAEARSVRKAA